MIRFVLIMALALSGVTVASAQDLVVDDTDGGFAILTGSWSTGTSSLDKYGTDYRYNTAGTGADVAQWTVNITTAGTYNVYCWYPQGSNRANNSPYTVNYNGGSQTIPVNQMTGGGTWNLLGTFSLVSGNNTVTLSDNAEAAKIVMADAVRWLFQSVGPTNTPTNTPLPTNTPVTTPESRMVSIDVWGLNTQAKLQNAIDQAAAHNMNSISVEIRYRGDALYTPNKTNSTYPNNEPRSEELNGQPPSYDALQTAVDYGHSRGLKVYAWAVTHVMWSSATAPANPNHIYNAHPEWITENNSGVTMTVNDAEGAYMDPGRLDVRDHNLNVFKDIIVNYDIDGFQFDYIRYPGSSYDRTLDWGFDSVATTRYTAETGRTANPTDIVWQNWKRSQVTAVVSSIWDFILVNKPSVALSACVFANRNDVTGWKFQDWKAWCEAPILDFLFTMTYSEDTATVMTQVDDQLANIGTRPLIVALKAYNGATYPASSLVDKVNGCRAKGAWESGKDGLGFYDSDGLQEYSHQFYDALFTGPLANWQRFPDTPARPAGTNTPTNTPTQTPTLGGPPPDAIVDNADAGFSILAGTWVTGTSAPDKYGADYRYHSVGTGTNQAQFAVNTLLTGSYNVYEWHPAGANRATNSPFTVSHSGGSTTVPVNQQVNGGIWNLLGTFNLNAGGNTVILTDNALPTGAYNVMADAIKWSWASGAATSTPTALPPTNTPTNTPTITPTNTPSNTPSNTPTATNTPVTYTIDDGDAGYVKTGTWTYSSNQGAEPLNGDFDYTTTVTGAATKNTKWTPTIATAGSYTVYVRYKQASTRANDAPYTVNYNGGSVIVDVNQTINGGTWVLLGTWNFAAGSAGNVQLKNGPAQKNKQVCSDAVKFEKQ